MKVVQFFNLSKNIAYANGWKFPIESDSPEGEWTRIESNMGILPRNLRKAALRVRSIEQENDSIERMKAGIENE